MKKKSDNVIIIGGTSGIGASVAIAMQRSGWNVGIAGRRLNILQNLKERYGFYIKQIDVSSVSAANDLNNFIHDMGGISLIIISAGTGYINLDFNFELDIYGNKT